MNYYSIKGKDQQYYNCLYLVKEKRNYSRLIKYDHSKYTITIPDEIEYTLTKDLYDTIIKEKNG